MLVVRAPRLAHCRTPCTLLLPQEEALSREQRWHARPHNSPPVRECLSSRSSCAPVITTLIGMTQAPLSISLSSLLLTHSAPPRTHSAPPRCSAPHTLSPHGGALAEGAPLTWAVLHACPLGSLQYWEQGPTGPRALPRLLARLCQQSIAARNASPANLRSLHSVAPPTLRLARKSAATLRSRSPHSAHLLPLPFLVCVCCLVVLAKLAVAPALGGHQSPRR